MTRTMVDTSAYCAFMRGHRGIVQEIRSATALYMSAIVLGELRAGFAVGGKRQQNEAELLDFLNSPRVQTITLDESTSVFYATIYCGLRKAGTPIPTNDLWIAAGAMQHGLVLLTLDRHFEMVPQIIVSRHIPEVNG